LSYSSRVGARYPQSWGGKTIRKRKKREGGEEATNRLPTRSGAWPLLVAGKGKKKKKKKGRKKKSSKWFAWEYFLEDRDWRMFLVLRGGKGGKGGRKRKGGVLYFPPREKGGTLAHPSSFRRTWEEERRKGRGPRFFASCNVAEMQAQKGEKGKRKKREGRGKSQSSFIVVGKKSRQSLRPT